MIRACFSVLFFVLLPSLAHAEVDPVAIDVPVKKGWTGQRVSFFVELRASGTFDGAAHFSLPKIPRSVVIPVGNPVVSSEEIEGDSWFIQRHEFALFSQQSGTVKIPPFQVRFASRKGFTGPAKDRQVTVPGASIEIQRPPGSERLGFLVTTESIEITETWDPQPGPAKMGDVFKRTISQSADQMTGIALAPPPETAPDGVRIYPGEPEVKDNTERGSFTGQRKDTITYVMQQAGKLTLPAITYVWWDPKAKQLQSKTLPSVTFDVAAPPVPAESNHSSQPARNWIWWIVGAAILCGVGIWKRQRIFEPLRICLHRINPPDRIAARHLLRACHHNDVRLASQFWLTWLNLQQVNFVPTRSLQSAATELQRHLYGSNVDGSWQGDQFEKVFREQLNEIKRCRRTGAASPLPPLNPSS